MNIVAMDEKKVPLSKMYFSMALPLVLSMVTAMIYNIADTWFISAAGNTNLIAGVSLNAPVLTLLMAFGNIYGQGGSSLISRLIGGKDHQSVRRVSSVCFYLALLTGVVVATVMLAFRTPILYLLGASEETLQYASSYYTCLAIGAPAIVFSFVPSNLLRSEGMSKEAMIDTMCGTVANIILDPILIYGLGMGAAGAATATVVAYLLTDLYAIVIICRKSQILSLNPREARTTRSNIAQIFGIGIPAALTNIMQSFSTVLMNQFLLAYGTDQIAAMGIALKVAQIGILVLVGLTFGALPLFGYYYGAQRREKFMELLHFCMRFIFTVAIVLTVVIFAAARPLIRFFVEDVSLISMGATMLRLQVISLLGVAVVLLITIVFQSIGKVKEMLFLSVSRQGVVFLVVLLVASAMAGYYGVIASQAISDVISAVLALILYEHWKKEYIRPLSHNQSQADCKRSHATAY